MLLYATPMYQMEKLKSYLRASSRWVANTCAFSDLPWTSQQKFWSNTLELVIIPHTISSFIQSAFVSGPNDLTIPVAAPFTECKIDILWFYTWSSSSVMTLPKTSIAYTGFHV